ncbi:MAG: ASCH domain-containing protein [Gemmataceae bacterium]
MTSHALSLKQPWATMLVHGIKCVEVRVWPTDRRGRILVHAARVPDPRPDAWKHIPPHLQDFTRLAGGIVGAATLVGCTTYRTAAEFAAEQELHKNELSWFRPPLYGFRFEHPEVLPFRRLPGWMRFFPVEE